MQIYIYLNLKAVNTAWVTDKTVSRTDLLEVTARKQSPHTLRTTQQKSLFYIYILHFRPSL